MQIENYFTKIESKIKISLFISALIKSDFLVLFIQERILKICMENGKKCTLLTKPLTLMSCGFFPHASFPPSDLYAPGQIKHLVQIISQDVHTQSSNKIITCSYRVHQLEFGQEMFEFFGLSEVLSRGVMIFVVDSGHEDRSTER